MSPAQAVKRARSFKVGDVVEVVWLDSGRSANKPGAGLIAGRLFGEVHSIDLKLDELEIATDYSVTRDGERIRDDAGNESYETVSLRLILEAYRLKRA